MNYLKRHRWAQFILPVLIILVGLWLRQFFVLRKAHRSFDDYAAFRGCQTITSRTATEGICRLADGSSIKIVQFRGKWYLDGDLPVFPWLN